MRIRESTSQDRDSIRGIHNNAFGEPEGPIVSQLACDILDDVTAMPVLSLIAEENNEMIGNIIFSAVRIEDSDKNISAYILAPLAVVKKRQGEGIGNSLINKGLSILRERGAELVFVLGDPNYYSRAGFEPATLYDLKPPYDLDHPEAWMVLELNQGSLQKAAGVVKCASSLSSEEHW